jgi:hypothetical protein
MFLDWSGVVLTVVVNAAEHRSVAFVALIH